MSVIYSLLMGVGFLIAGAVIGYLMYSLRRTPTGWKLDSEATAGLFRTDDADPELLTRKISELGERVDATPSAQFKLAEIIRLVQTQTANIEQIMRDARTDSLTGLWNRRALDEQLPLQFNFFQRYETPLSLIMVDIDHFKQINDEFGHPVGDEALRHLGRIMRDNLRTSDFVARYGGEEFVILLPQTDLAGALATTERLRKTLYNRPLITSDGPIEVHISVGIAQARVSDNACDLLARADQALLKAKRSGRNQIGIETGWSGKLAIVDASVN